jgi:hypothetical protein
MDHKSEAIEMKLNRTKEEYHLITDMGMKAIIFQLEKRPFLNENKYSDSTLDNLNKDDFLVAYYWALKNKQDAIEIFQTEFDNRKALASQHLDLFN